jgi:tripartite ATP-independent transporter DctM subunit
MMALIIAGYIIIRCVVQPELAPAGEVKNYPLSEKLRDSAYYILPIAIVVFLVIGVMMLGIATPTEAAVTGVVGTLILAAFYRKLNFTLLKTSFNGALEISIMIFMMILAATAFAQLLAFSGATAGLSSVTSALPVAPIIIIVMMQIVVLILGCFMDTVAILMVTLPIFMPIVHNLGLNDVWFGVMLLINTQVAGISPPFGLNLFVMKGVMGKKASMGEIYRAGGIFSLISIIAMAVILFVPPVALWLPSLMKPING